MRDIIYLKKDKLDSKAKKLDFIRILGESLCDLPYSQRILDQVSEILKIHGAPNNNKEQTDHPNFKSKTVYKAYNVQINHQIINK